MSIRTFTSNNYYACSSRIRQSHKTDRSAVCSMRTRQVPEQNVLVKIARTVVSEISEMISWMVSPQSKKTSMCETYGHIIRGAWGDHRPSCDDCGITIRGPEQLRKSTPKVKK